MTFTMFLLGFFAYLSFLIVAGIVFTEAIKS
jgi:hypothetical protein